MDLIDLSIPMYTLAPFTSEHSLLLLVHYYGEPHRRFHGPTHLLDVMRLWADCTARGCWTDSKQALTAGIALGFHDARCNPGDSNNEETSAAIAMVESKRYGVDPERVREMVMATKRHTDDFDTDPDIALLLDIDVARLGREREDYLLASHEIRLEYAEFNNRQWVEGRSTFLDAMLARRSIYRTSVALPGTTEERARTNLEYERGYLAPLVDMLVRFGELPPELMP